MGQAKRRGSFEDRKAQSIARSKAEAEASFAAYQKRLAANPAARPTTQARNRRRMSTILAAATIAAAAWPH